MERSAPFRVNPDELDFCYSRSPGPGGQNVNKVSTAVQLRFDLQANCSLPVALKDRLRRLAGSRLSSDDVLIISAHRFRSQERNRADALEKLEELIGRAARTPRPRRTTRPGPSAIQKRLDHKRTHAAKKQLRRSSGLTGE